MHTRADPQYLLNAKHTYFPIIEFQYRLEKHFRSTIGLRVSEILLDTLPKNMATRKPFLIFHGMALTETEAIKSFPKNRAEPVIKMGGS
jgi:hypothetical protein